LRGGKVNTFGQTGGKVFLTEA